MTPALRSFEAQWRGRAADPLSHVRGQAMERFMRLGIPTLRDESWRYTDLRSLVAQSFVDAPQGMPIGAEAHQAPLLKPAESAVTVVMMNGRPVLPALPIHDGNNITINSLRELSRIDPMLLSRHLEPLSDAEQQRWSLLNTALFVDGLYLKITGKLAAPILVLRRGRARLSSSSM
jgi:Fe-S cluster assembly protein SufD